MNVIQLILCVLFIGRTEAASTVQATFSSTGHHRTTTQSAVSGDKTSHSTDGNQVCSAGWERCADGTCEPFHWMCTEHDGNYTFTRPPTSPHPETEAPPPTTTTTPPTTTTELAVTVTVIPGTDGTCMHGWELCEDKTCEPYHWMCMEHGESSIVIGRRG